jgi:hypothetical protein
MSAVNVEPVSVLRRADEPAHFLWQGRLYAVRAVRAHWIEPFEGGADPHAGSPEAGGTVPAALPALPVRGADDGTLVGEQAGWPHGQAQPDGHEVAGDRELWRVEAAAGRTARTGVFDLCVAWPAGRWTLTPVEDL